MVGVGFGLVDCGAGEVELVIAGRIALTIFNVWIPRKTLSRISRSFSSVVPTEAGRVGREPQEARDAAPTGDDPELGPSAEGYEPVSL